MFVEVSVLFLSNLLFLLSFLLLLPIAILLIECTSALLLDPREVDDSGNLDNSDNRIAKPKIAILVPAHNEKEVINQTLTALLPQLDVHDRLIVIADNCTDNTADLARKLNVTAIERNNIAQIGKGYALDYGLNFLKSDLSDLPDVVIMVDADCIVCPNTINRIALEAVRKMRPIQAVYLMESHTLSSPKSMISALAFKIKNLVRPSGLNNLGLPCLLTGTGMAFPWSVICDVSLASDNLVEDMQLGIDLAIAGYPPLFSKKGKVTGLLPQQAKAASNQKMRWIHGHLQTIRTQVPRLFKEAWQQKRLDLATIALDISIPPLSLLVIGWMTILCSALILGTISHQWITLMLALFEGILIFGSIAGAWLKFARQDIPIKTLLSTPIYILWKTPILLAFWRNRQEKWIRTERDIIVPQSTSLD